MFFRPQSCFSDLSGVSENLVVFFRPQLFFVQTLVVFFRP